MSYILYIVNMLFGQDFAYFDEKMRLRIEILSIKSFSLHQHGILKRTGADKVSNRPVTTFSITSSPIIYRAKALAYVTILTSKLLAFHRALTDFKKRLKLHFRNKNCKNDLSIPDVFVCNIAMTPPSSSYHLIQLFKYYKSIPCSKIRNTGHCP